MIVHLVCLRIDSELTAFLLEGEMGFTTSTENSTIHMQYPDGHVEESSTWKASCLGYDDEDISLRIWVCFHIKRGHRSICLTHTCLRTPVGVIGCHRVGIMRWDGWFRSSHSTMYVDDLSFIMRSMKSFVDSFLSPYECVHNRCGGVSTKHSRIQSPRWSVWRCSEHRTRNRIWKCNVNFFVNPFRPKHFRLYVDMWMESPWK
jgi:hypothetical protein